MSEDTFREPASVEAHPDMLTLDQLEQIKKDISTNQPMVGPIEPIAELLELYKESQSSGFVPGIHFLSGVFNGMRRIRGDGNCFYRGLLFGYLESVLRIAKSGNETDLADAKLEIERISGIIRGSMADLVAVGYSEFTIEVFYDEMMELLDTLLDQTPDSLLEMFQEGGKADYVTWYMRALTAGYLKRDADRFLPFVEGLYFDMDAFCKAEVEPMDKECEHIHIIALTEYLGLIIRIAYLDGRPFDPNTGLSFVTFPDPSSGITAPSPEKFKVDLLYRPGHYDVLYNN